MRTILYFDYAALFILFTILISNYVRKIASGIINTLFIIMTVMSIMTVMCDVLFEATVAPLQHGDILSDIEVLYAYFIAYSYFFLRNTLGFVFLLFTFSLTRTMFKIRRKEIKVLLFLPYVLFLIALSSNFLTGSLFKISAYDGYSRGGQFYWIYILTVIYLIIGLMNLILNKSLFSIEKWIALIFMYTLTFSAIIFQYYHPTTLVELFSTAISLMLIILVVVRPEEITDPLVGELSIKAYLTELNKIKSTRQPVQIAAINVKNAIEIRNFLGEEMFGAYMMKFIDSIRKLCKEERISFQIYSDMPDNIYVLIDNMDYDIEGRMMGILDFKEFEASSMRLVARLCVIKCPKDVNKVPDIIYISRNYGDMIGNLQRFTRAADLTHTRDYRIRKNIDSILTRAIKHKKFELYYQPIYSVKEKKFVSAEALIRLNDPLYGAISPGLFIPLAESRGLINPIGDIVLESVYSLVSKNDFRESGIQYIDVNLSVAQCIRNDIVDKIKELEEEYGVSRNKIKMEITETYLGESIDEIIYSLADMGYDFALDDYGTGYSNIHRILELPLRIIKIDKTLVNGMKTKTGFTILKSTVDMLQSVDLKIIVEGVEDEESFRQLEKMGVDYIQGYYFSRPLPENEFLELIKKQKGGEGEVEKMAEN